MTENNVGVQQKKVISEKNQGLQHMGRKVVEVGTLLLGNDKNNVTANKVLSYF